MVPATRKTRTASPVIGWLHQLRHLHDISISQINKYLKDGTFLYVFLSMSINRIQGSKVIYVNQNIIRVGLNDLFVSSGLSQ